VTARMNLWQELRRKMGGSPEAVLEKRRELAERLEQQGDIEGTLAKLDKQIHDVEKQLQAKAAGLLKTREKAAVKLGSEVAKSIASLGFVKAGFEVEVIREDKLTLNGGSRCQ